MIGRVGPQFTPKVFYQTKTLLSQRESWLRLINRGVTGSTMGEGSASSPAIPPLTDIRPSLASIHSHATSREHVWPGNLCKQPLGCCVLSSFTNHQHCFITSFPY